MTNYFHYLGKNHELFFRYLGALYYTEHVHIDTHHGRMALEKLILPIVDHCGPAVIPEVVRGFDEFRVINDLADKDFAAQVAWMDGGPNNKSLHNPIWAQVEQGAVGYDSHQILESGQGTVIWRNRLHGAVIESDECVYEIHSVGDYQACLS